jgi:adenylate kinase family enzyme
MKINIIGPSCVGKSTLAEVIAKKNNWNHFDLDLVFIDHDYLAQTKNFRYKSKIDRRKKINEILISNKDWIIEGVYLVKEILEQSDLIIFINLPIIVPLKWQWKRYFTDINQRNTYGLLNNLGLTKEIFNEYFQKYENKNLTNEMSFSMTKYKEIIKIYDNKSKVVSNIDDLKKLRLSGDYNKL